MLIALYSVRSNRALCEQPDYNLLFRWFLDMSLDEKGLDQSNFSRLRSRLVETNVALRFFEQVLRLARSHELLSTEHFTVDLTLPRFLGPPSLPPLRHISSPWQGGSCTPAAGSQYSAEPLRDALEAIGALQSMSGKGNAYDNAPMESFFSSLKGESLDHEHYRTRDEARAAVFAYIETFYNTVRMHSGIGYRSPNRFEAMLRVAD